MADKKKTTKKKTAASPKPASPKAARPKAGSSKAGSSKAVARKRAAPKAADTFPEAFAALLRKRKIKVPAGLADAPPAAYADQPASVVEQLASLGDDTLRKQAEKVAGYAGRHAERARRVWDESPLIVEMRRRKLKLPKQPAKVVGAAFSIKKPLREWSDAELRNAAEQWSKRGNA
jgi:hypothetical protein